ncbi:MAG: hypothetical protein EOO52_05155 [Gammaproteobacteria bacterium]|nr:MAG: hypothetical protein EOO52_05155 [Gammaproteobacteria bacterium]
MIKNSFMAAILFLYSINAISQTEITGCNFFDKTQAANSGINSNLCGFDSTQKQTEGFANEPNEEQNKKSFPFHVGKNKSSLAESLTVVLFIPGLIILLFSRLIKSAK